MIVEFRVFAINDFLLVLERPDVSAENEKSVEFDEIMMTTEF